MYVPNRKHKHRQRNSSGETAKPSRNPRENTRGSIYQIYQDTAGQALTARKSLDAVRIGSEERATAIGELAWQIQALTLTVAGNRKMAAPSVALAESLGDAGLHLYTTNQRTPEGHDRKNRTVAAITALAEAALAVPANHPVEQYRAYDRFFNSVSSMPPEHEALRNKLTEQVGEKAEAARDFAFARRAEELQERWENIPDPQPRPRAGQNGMPQANGMGIPQPAMSG